MLSLFLAGVSVVLLGVLLISVSFMLGMKYTGNREANSPFECGFTPSDYSRKDFSIRFFVIAVIFLIFDVEIALLFPLFITFFYSEKSVWGLLSLSFLLILLIGTFFEWKEGVLDWKI